MGENGKELLKQHIKNKRVSEGLTEIPLDLYAKKPRYEMMSNDADKMNERRQKNKEAAEKSRKKKKEEFTMLQTENDQLEQDKCQLVAMIDKLKSDLGDVTKENNGLRYNIDHLKRWIGKHANDLGLGKHMQKKQAEGKGLTAKTAEFSDSDSVLKGDPSLHSLGALANSDQLLSGSRSPASSSGSRSPCSSSRPASPPTSPSCQRPAPAVSPSLPRAVPKCPSPQLLTQDLFQAVGIRTLVSHPQLPAAPMVVDQPQVSSHFSRVGQQGEVIYTEGQQVIYLPKDTVFIVQGGDGQPAMMADVQHVSVDVPQAQHVSMEARVVNEVNMETPQVQEVGVEIPEVQGDKVKTLEVQGDEVENPEVHGDEVENPEVQGDEVENPEVQGDEVENPEVQEVGLDASQVQQITGEAPEMQTLHNDYGNSGSVQEVLHSQGMDNSVAAKETTETTANTESVVLGTGSHPSLASSIEILLKMGCKIQLPGGVQLLSAPEETTTQTV